MSNLCYLMTWNEDGTGVRSIQPTKNVFLFLLCQFLISIVVERPYGREIAKPVELRVMVGDANDNRPTFPQAQYHTVVKELAARGNSDLFIYVFIFIYFSIIQSAEQSFVAFTLILRILYRNKAEKTLSGKDVAMIKECQIFF